jgi:hypothetical protein
MRKCMSIGGDSAEVILTIVNVQIFMAITHIHLPNGGKFALFSCRM